MDDRLDSQTLKKEEKMSFFYFLLTNYELSKFVLPKKKPVNDVLSEADVSRLTALMEDKDFYEINSIIKSRYKTISAS